MAMNSMAAEPGKKVGAELTHRTIIHLGHYRDMDLRGIEPGVCHALLRQM